MKAPHRLGKWTGCLLKSFKLQLEILSIDEREAQATEIRTPRARVEQKL